MGDGAIALVGVLSAFLSAIAAVFAARSAHQAVRLQRRSVEPDLRVTLSYAIAMYPGHGARETALISVANAGLIPVDLVSVGFLPRDKGTMPIMGPEGFGGSTVLGWLEPGRSVTAVYDLADLADAAARAPGGIRGVFAQTAANGQFEGDADVDSVLRNRGITQPM